MKQFILPDDFSGQREFTLKDEDFHYLCRVLRKRKGDEITALDSNGNSWNMTLGETAENSCSVFLEQLKKEKSGETEITLVQCLPKGKKMDLIIRQAIETGVRQIIPVLSDHAVPRFENENEMEKKRQRWEKIAREAMQQSGSVIMPAILKPVKMDEIPALWNNKGPALYCHQERIDDGTLHKYLNETAQKVCLVVGPEGGLSARELDILEKGGFNPVYLGDTVLRTETAALFVTAAVKVILLEKIQWKLK